MNPIQTNPKGAIFSGYFAIVDTDKKNEAKVSACGKMGKFVYLACPTNPLKGPELSTLNLAWVQSSILWQYFLYYANILKKRE